MTNRPTFTNTIKAHKHSSRQTLSPGIFCFQGAGDVTFKDCFSLFANFNSFFYLLLFSHIYVFIYFKCIYSLYLLKLKFIKALLCVCCDIQGLFHGLTLLYYFIQEIKFLAKLYIYHNEQLNKYHILHFIRRENLF